MIKLKSSMQVSYLHRKKSNYVFELLFGEEIKRANYGQDSIRQKFTSYERDNETELDFAQARFYNSKLGRFNSVDPLYFQLIMAIDPQRFNLYGYTRNNPFKWVDPDGEKLHLRGDTGWLQTNVLYEMAGGQENFNKYFEVVDGEVLLRDGVDTSNVNQGVSELLSLVNANENYLYFAGGNDDAEAAATLLQGTIDKKGNLTAIGRELADKFRGDSFPSGRIISTSGREGYQEPYRLENGDPVFAVIAWNYEYDKETPFVQTGVSTLSDNAFSQASRETQESGIGQVVKAVSVFIHESAENRSFATMTPAQRSTRAGYEIAHRFGIYREALIRNNLKITGGFAGGSVSRRRQ